MNGQGWLRSRHVAEVSQTFLTDVFGQFIASCPVADFIGHCATSRTARGCCELIYNHRHAVNCHLRLCRVSVLGVRAGGPWFH